MPHIISYCPYFVHYNKREEIKRIIRDSNSVIILAVECQMDELPLVVPEGIEVGAIDIFEETALVQFAKMIHRAVVIYTDKELQEEEKESERRNERLDSKGGSHGP